MEDLDEDLARYNEKPERRSFFHDLLHKLDKIITLQLYGRLSRGNLYNEHYTSIIATPNQPESQDTIATATSAGYTQHRINEKIGRNASKLYVINDGPIALYVVTTPDAKKWSADEAIIYSGESREFYDVYEIRVRTPEADHKYRVTEYDHKLAYSSSGTPNRSSLVIRTEDDIAILGVGTTQLPDVTVPNGFTVVIRADPTNTGIVYIATTVARLGAVATRAPLNAGDVVRFYITNVNLLHVAGSVANQDVNIFVEQ